MGFTEKIYVTFARRAIRSPLLIRLWGVHALQSLVASQWLTLLSIQSFSGLFGAKYQSWSILTLKVLVIRILEGVAMCQLDGPVVTRKLLNSGAGYLPHPLRRSRFCFDFFGSKKVFRDYDDYLI